MPLPPLAEEIRVIQLSEQHIELLHELSLVESASALDLGESLEGGFPFAYGALVRLSTAGYVSRHGADNDRVRRRYEIGPRGTRTVLNHLDEDGLPLPAYKKSERQRPP